MSSHDDKQYKKRSLEDVADDCSGDMVVNDSCLSNRRMLNDEQSTDMALLHYSHNDREIIQGYFNTYMLLHKTQNDSNLDMDKR